jgi:ABC-2 type transport system permease protein
VFTFQVGGFFERGQADLQPFFRWHPWIYLVLIPAISMRLWAEERNSGSIELLMTMPLTLWQAVVGKFLAAWVFAGVALALTFPIWITVNYLGSPDNGTILAAYVGSWLMAGGFLAIGTCLSAATRNQVIAFVTAALVGFLFLLAGFPLVLDLVRGVVPAALVDTIASLSFLTHFDAISKGVIDIRDIVYFAALIGFWLAATAIVLDMKKAQ